MNSFFSALGLGPSNAQLQKNKELAQSDLSDAVEMTGGKRRRRSKRKASKRKASKRSKASKRK
jgi:hypothetical protein